MKKCLFFILFICFFIFSQDIFLKNGGFEKGERLPSDWKCDTWQPAGQIGDAIVLTEEKYSEGKKSIKIDTSRTTANYIELKQGISPNLKGKKVNLKGKLFFEKVEGEGIFEIYFRIRQFENKEYTKIGEDALRTWIVVEKDKIKISETKIFDNKVILGPQNIISDFTGKWISFSCSGIINDNEFPKEIFISIPTFKGLKGIFYIDDLVLTEETKQTSFEIEIKNKNIYAGGNLNLKLKVPDEWEGINAFLYIEKCEDGHLIRRKEIARKLNSGENLITFPIDGFVKGEYNFVVFIKQEERVIKVFRDTIKLES